MPQQIASLVFALFIAGLFYLDRKPGQRTSPALWIPIIWMFIGSSRMVSQWFGPATGIDNPDQYLDGSPIDRYILTGLLAIGIGVLIARKGRVGAILRQNAVLVIFFLYCVASVFWSDFPLVAFKRWTKALGNLVMVLVVVTDGNPSLAIKRLFTWTGYFLIPLSVLLIKYYPDLGRGYWRWSWEVFYTGVSTDKNGLGAICLIFGLAMLWAFFAACREERGTTRAARIAAYGIVLVSTLWLFQKANSSTAIGCFLLGSAVVMMTASRSPRLPARVHAIFGAVIGGAIFIFLFPEAYASLVSALGRTTTLTGRTDIWQDLFKVHKDVWLGTGFESFWLGSRAEYFWHKYYFHPNQAHNGYIETYINLGFIGLGLMLVVLGNAYRNVITALKRREITGQLMAALLLMAILYNITEAAFKVMHPMWITFLLAATSVPEFSRKPRESIQTAKADGAFAPGQLLQTGFAGLGPLQDHETFLGAPGK